MQDDRKLAVLRAIVEDYVSTQEPVGSKALVERHSLGVSPATVRNDMAALEEEGFITQPHTSAGRIPTDKGYRLFVDRLTTLKPMSTAEKRAIATFLDGAVDLDDVVHRSVRLLSQLTHQVAVVQYPTLSRSTVRHVELVALVPTRRAGGADPRRPAGSSSGWSSWSSRSATTTWPTIRATVHRAVIGETIANALNALRAFEHGRRRGRRPRRWSRRSSRRCPTTAPTSGWWSAAPPTSPGTATRSTSTYAPCSRPSRSTSCCSSCSARPTRGGVLVRIGHEGPYEELAATSVVVDRLRPGRRGAGEPGHRRPHPHGLPRHDGRRARRRPLRLAHPRRGVTRAPEKDR